MTQTNKLQDSDKQTRMADDCFLQTRKFSIFQNHVFETKTLRTFPLFLSSGSSNFHSIFRLRLLPYNPVKNAEDIWWLVKLIRETIAKSETSK